MISTVSNNLVGDNIKILYESNNYLVVEKPPDLLINSDDENNLNTLQHALSAITLDDSHKSKILKHKFHFIHRLDFATSGVICLGKNKTASASAGRLFESRLVDKYYIALVRGHLKTEFMSIKTSIGYDEKFLGSNKKMCPEGKNCINPKKALTKILVLENGTFDGFPATKIMLKPETGRRHQLRLHCKLLGHTIIGDYTYSDGEDNKPSRMYLHSHRLIIPIDYESLDVSSPDPFIEAHCNEWKSKCVINQINETENLNPYSKLKHSNCDISKINNIL